MNQTSNQVLVKYLWSWRAYVILAIPTIAAVPIPRTPFEPTTVQSWLIASTIGYVVIGLCLLTLRFVVFRSELERRISLRRAALIGAVIGFIKGLTTGTFASLLGVGLGGMNEVLVRAVPASLLGAAIIGLTSLIVTNVADFQNEWKQLVQVRAQALDMQATEKIELEQNASALQSLISKELNLILEQCAIALQELSDRPVETQWQALSSLLRRAATEHIQPLSRRLWNSPQDKPPRITQAIKAAARSAQIPFVGPIILAAIAFVPARSGLVSPEVLIRELAVYLLLISTSLAFMRFLTRRIQRLRFTLLLVSGLFSGLTVLLTVEIMDSQNSLSRTALNVWWLILLTISFGLAQSLLRQREIIFSSLRADAQAAQIEAAALRQANRRMYRELGQYLHSTVQSRLMASALLIDSNPNQQTAWYRERLEGTIQILAAPLSEFRSNVQSIETALRELADKWNGILAVGVEVVGQHHTTRTADVVAVVQEAISNASRHGLAQRVNVVVEFQDSHIDIDVFDDGIGPRLGPRGLGSSFFDEVGQWSLSPQESGQGSHFHMSLQA